MHDKKDAMSFPEKCVSQRGMRCYEDMKSTDRTENKDKIQIPLSLYRANTPQYTRIIKEECVPVHLFFFKHFPLPLRLLIPHLA